MTCNTRRVLRNAFKIHLTRLFFFVAIEIRSRLPYLKAAPQNREYTRNAFPQNGDLFLNLTCETRAIQSANQKTDTFA